MKNLLRQIGWFVAVGCAAALTHWLVAIGSVRVLGLEPYIANFIGWLVAMVVSFAGHYRLTFRHESRRQLWPSIWRFVAVSAAGFSVNEVVFVLILKFTALPYELVLAAVLIGVAGLTFLLSRYWVFRNKA